MLKAKRLNLTKMGNGENALDREAHLSGTTTRGMQMNLLCLPVLGMSGPIKPPKVGITRLVHCRVYNVIITSGPP